MPLPLTGAVQACLRSTRLRHAVRQSWRWVLLGLGLALAWHALEGVAWAEVGDLLDGLGPGAILTLLAFNLLLLPVMTARWWLLLRALGWPVGLRDACAYRTAANAVSYLTPGPHVGGEPLSVHCLHSRQGVPLTSAATSVAVDRLLEVLASIAVLTFCLLNLVFSNSRWLAVDRGLPLLITVLVLLALLLAALFTGQKPFSRSLRQLDTRLGRYFPATAGSFRSLIDIISQGEAEAHTLYRGHRRQFLLANLLSLVHWLGIFAEFWLMSFFLGMPLSLGQLTTVVAVARLAFFTPLPAGMGVLEAALPWVTALLGPGSALGLSLCLLMRCRDLLFNLAGWGLAMHYLTCRGKAGIVRGQ